MTIRSLNNGWWDFTIGAQGFSLRAKNYGVQVWSLVDDRLQACLFTDEATLDLHDEVSVERYLRSIDIEAIALELRL